MRSLAGLLSALVRDHGDRLAFVDGTATRTFRAFDEDVARLAGALAAAGVKPGDRVAAMLAAGLPTMTLLFAAARLGAIVVAINWRLAPAEIAYVLGHSEPTLALVSPRFDEAWRETGVRIPTVP
ncbi:MAG TPA: AMP-binding protein, partial [Nevskiaceae bacterium]|nr:AMP-binding protein [Nevskiaceae bacterium]